MGTEELISLVSFHYPKVSFEKNKAFFFIKKKKRTKILLSPWIQRQRLSCCFFVLLREPEGIQSGMHTLCTSLCGIHERIWGNDDVVVERRDGSRGILKMSFSVDPAHLSSERCCHGCISPPTGIKSYNTTEAPWILIWKWCLCLNWPCALLC